MVEITKYLTESAKVRFLSKIDRRGGCWLWTAGTFKNFGYGAFKLGKQVVPAHRVMWALTHGEDPPGMVLHSCDNPPCVYIQHLRIGTPKDNSQDAVRRGRRNFWKIRGERNGNAKLKDATVARIRELYATGEYSGYKLGEMFDCTPQAVYLIVNGKRRSQPTVPLDVDLNLVL